MDTEIHLTLPYPPSVNTAWRFVPRVGVKISAQGRAYRKAVKADVHRILGRPEPLDGWLAVNAHWYCPDRRKRDTDNPTKSLLDALTHAGIWLDDYQVEELHLYRHRKESHSFKGGHADVEVRRLWLPGDP